MKARIGAVLIAALVVLSIAGPGLVAAAEPDTPEPGEAYGDNKAGPLADEMFGMVLYNIPESAQMDASGHPQAVVQYESGEHQQLATWANESEQRRVVWNDTDDAVAVVAAPRAHLTGDWSLGSLDVSSSGVDVTLPGARTGLSDLDFVVGWEVNRVLEGPEPVRPADNATYTAPDHLFGKGEFNKQGLAFDGDANVSTEREAKQLHNATGVAVDGSGVRVAVLDTGLNVRNATDSDHYQDRLGACKNFIANETGCDNVSTDTQHGPWTAAAIAADPDPNATDEPYEGMAPGATLMVGKALNDEGKASLAQIARAIEWAAKGPDGEYDTGDEADVISLSLGSQQYSPIIADRIQEALDNGVTAVVVASGNSRMHPTHTRYIGHPADVDGVIAVAATNVSLTDQGRPNLSRVGPAYFSSPGPDDGFSDGSEGVTKGAAPDVGAAGMKVEVPVIDANGYRRNVSLSGTSMAAPEVSGAVALLLEAEPGLENESARVRERVRQTTSAVRQAGVYDIGTGLLDVQAMLANDTDGREQSEVRTAEAEARDTANAAYAADSDGLLGLTATSSQLDTAARVAS